MRVSERNPALAEKIRQMRLTIAPILHVSTGLPPPHFPPTILQLFLLTEPQLDSFASFYSQTSPSSPHFYAYPQTMDFSRPFLSTDPNLPDDCKLNDFERLKVKMRMFAKFIGMRGAETPRWEYEKQVELLGRKIEWMVKEEEGGSGWGRGKGYWGPEARPS